VKVAETSTFVIVSFLATPSDCTRNYRCV